MSARLQAVAPGLVAHASNADPEQRRTATLQVVRAVVSERPLNDPRAEAALRSLTEHRVGATAERRQLELLVAELDEVAWSLQDAEGESSNYMLAFQTARAGMSLWFALDDDSRLAALESWYEAITATSVEQVAAAIGYA